MPVILLRESCRADGKVKNRTQASLSGWPAEWVETLRALLSATSRVLAWRPRRDGTQSSQKPY